MAPLPPMYVGHHNSFNNNNNAFQASSHAALFAAPHTTRDNNNLAETYAPLLPPVTEDLPSGFDEFPAPLASGDLALLENEIFRLTKAQRSLAQALFFYKKQGDKAQVTAVAAEARLKEASADDSTGGRSAQSDLGKRPREADTLNGGTQDVICGGAGAAAEPAPSSAVLSTIAPTPTYATANPTEGSVAVEASPSSGGDRPRRRFTQSAALLAGMQKMIAANQQRDVATGIGGANVRQERERMAKEARRNALVDQVTVAKDNVAKAQRAVKELQEKHDPVRGRLAMLSALLDAAEVQEADYVSSFFLRCGGSTGTPAAAVVAGTSAYDGNVGDAASHADVGVDAYRAAKDEAVMVTSLVGYVYAQPANHNDTTREVVRQQLYHVLDGYLAFREQIDPILTSIKDARDTFLEKRRRQLQEEAQQQQQQQRHGGHHHRGGGSGSRPPHHIGSIGGGGGSFVPMSPEEAALILRSSSSSTTTSTAAPRSPQHYPISGAGGDQLLHTRGGGAIGRDGGPDGGAVTQDPGATTETQQSELEWSVYESAMAALDDFE